MKVSLVRLEIKESIAWVTLDNPPMNALGDATKEDLDRVLDALEEPKSRIPTFSVDRNSRPKRTSFADDDLNRVIRGEIRMSRFRRENESPPFRPLSQQG